MQTLSSWIYGGRSYVRPAPSGAGTLGGLSTFTHDVVTLCQVSGFELVIVETVGLGQSEVEVEQAVDMLLLLVPPAGGDDLQGVKKGIVEVADLVVVTKADGQLLPAAQQTASDYMRAMPYVRSFYKQADVLPGWEQPKVLLVSSATAEGLDKVWQHVSQFRQQIVDSKRLEEKRKQQDRYWMWKNLQFLVRLQLQRDPNLRSKSASLQDQLHQGRITPRVAATQLLELFHQPSRQEQR
jgi:LAO/AO transport system kinase